MKLWRSPSRSPKGSHEVRRGSHKVTIGLVYLDEQRIGTKTTRDPLLPVNGRAKHILVEEDQMRWVRREWCGKITWNLGLAPDHIGHFLGNNWKWEKREIERILSQSSWLQLILYLMASLSYQRPFWSRHKSSRLITDCVLRAPTKYLTLIQNQAIPLLSKFIVLNPLSEQDQQLQSYREKYPLLQHDKWQ